MKVVLQRVSKASVSIENNVVGSIDCGYVIFLGIGHEDTENDAQFIVDKLTKLRVMSDEQGKMNRSLLDVDGEVLVISQFTLYADTKRGRRPSFVKAASPEKAEKLYEFFIKELKKQNVKNVQTGKFGAYMKVDLVNDGPVTIILDSC